LYFVQTSKKKNIDMWIAYYVSLKGGGGLKKEEQLMRTKT